MGMVTVLKLTVTELKRKVSFTVNVLAAVGDSWIASIYEDEEELFGCVWKGFW
jgi:hypothetical protein